MVAGGGTVTVGALGGFVEPAGSRMTVTVGATDCVPPSATFSPIVVDFLDDDDDPMTTTTSRATIEAAAPTSHRSEIAFIVLRPVSSPRGDDSAGLHEPHGAGSR